MHPLVQLSKIAEGCCVSPPGLPVKPVNPSSAEFTASMQLLHMYKSENMHKI